MIGIDTNILVAYSIPDHPLHGRVRERIDQFLSEGQNLAMTSGILAEFIHVVTDPKPFDNTLSMEEALGSANMWSNAEEVVLQPIGSEAHLQWMRWLGQHRLGRKRFKET